MGLPIGDTCFKYPAAVPTVTVPLRAPIREIEPIDSTPMTGATSFDKTKTERITFGSTIYELMCTLRYINNPRAVLDMLTTMAKDGTLVSYHDPCGGAADFTNAELVAPTGKKIKLKLDRDLGKWGRYEVRIHLRRTDGGDFDSVLTAGL